MPNPSLFSFLSFAKNLEIHLNFVSELGSLILFSPDSNDRTDNTLVVNIHIFVGLVGKVDFQIIQDQKSFISGLFIRFCTLFCVPPESTFTAPR